MPFDDLRQWIAALDRAGQLKRIQTEADPILEIAEITDRVSKSRDAHGAGGGPALLFQNVKGFPGSQLLINQFGSEARMKLAMGVSSYDEIGARIRMFMEMKSPHGFLDKLKMLPLLTEAGKFFPRTVPTGPCKEVIRRDNFSLLNFPILQCWPKDAGRFITLPCVTTRDPKSGKRNLGMYRMQVYDERTTGMHWQRQKVAAEHARERMRAAVEGRSAAVDIMARTSGGSVLAEGDRPSGKMEVAVAIGTDPAVTFSAIVPAPPEIEEYLIAGFLRDHYHASVFDAALRDDVVCGAEIGLRTRLVPKLESSVSLFLLDSASEILFSGDAGDTSASRPADSTSSSPTRMAAISMMAGRQKRSARCPKRSGKPSGGRACDRPPLHRHGQGSPARQRPLRRLPHAGGGVCDRRGAQRAGSPWVRGFGAGTAAH